MSGWSAPETINLNPGTFSSANGAVNNIGIAEGTVIQTAIGGSGGDTIIGNSYNDILFGAGGNDLIIGGTGTDTARYSGSRAQYQVTLNANGSIHLADIRPGSPDGTDDVSNVEFFQFADVMVGAANFFHPPVVTAPDFSGTKGQIISVSSLFTASDADNDTLTYYFYDNTADAASGHFTVNGVVQAANTSFAVSQAQLAQTTFTAGFVSDDLIMNVSDGLTYSGNREFHVNVPPNHAPVVTTPDFSASKGQIIGVSSLFTASDADNDTLTYYVYDNTADVASGHFNFNGVAQPANTSFAVSQAQLTQTTFTAGSAMSDDLIMNVSDGSTFSGNREFHVNVPPNHAPAVTATDFSASKGQVIGVSSLFTASDADNDTLTYYFYDNTPGATSGHFTFNGVVQAANTAFAVSEAQLTQTTFTAGLVSDDLIMNVSDGSTFSGNREFHVNVPPNHAPAVTATDFSASKGQVIGVSSLFTASDADNDTLTYYFYDNTADAKSGHFTVNGVAQHANTSFAVTQAQLAQTTFTAGSVSDDLIMNVFDGWPAPGSEDTELGVILEPEVVYGTQTLCTRVQA